MVKEPVKLHIEQSITNANGEMQQAFTFEGEGVIYQLRSVIYIEYEETLDGEVTRTRLKYHLSSQSEATAQEAPTEKSREAECLDVERVSASRKLSIHLKNQPTISQYKTPYGIIRSKAQLHALTFTKEQGKTEGYLACTYSLASEQTLSEDLEMPSIYDLRLHFTGVIV